MIEWNSTRPQLEYKVTVGHMVVTVLGATREEAIEKARIKLSRDLPRLWDVIHGLAASRFVVACCSDQ